ncbi:hypothetical protein TNCV_2732341 [Trichonephila clavipes]|nr:hypothetical protein TNCV_2732341 [Trichonephila clavipes]
MIEADFSSPNMLTYEPDAALYDSQKNLERARGLVIGLCPKRELQSPSKQFSRQNAQNKEKWFKPPFHK